MSNRDLFWSTYEDALTECVSEMPDRYSYGQERVKQVVADMRARLFPTDDSDAKAVSLSGPAFYRTFKRLKIDGTYTAIRKFFKQAPAAK